MAEVHLHTPLSPDGSKALRVGDIVYISGELLFCRDKAHVRMREFAQQHRPLPLRLEGIPLYHAGPVVRKVDGSWEIIAAGPTTSSRMEEHEADILRLYRPQLIIGKGGMGRRTLDALMETGGAYAVFPGGAALLAAKHMRGVKAVYWMDLGIPDALWNVTAEEFGPCVVTMDSAGSSLHEGVNAQSLLSLRALLSRDR
jgi:fumarate hydratase subunit beta